jgi:hypothetical protein
MPVTVYNREATAAAAVTNQANEPFTVCMKPRSQIYIFIISLDYGFMEDKVTQFFNL